MTLPFAKACHFVRHCSSTQYQVENNIYYTSLLEISTDEQEVAVHWFEFGPGVQFV